LSDPELNRIYRSALPGIDGQPLSKMPRNLYGYVWAVGAGQQIRLCLLTLVVFPLSLVPIELQRRIVDDAIANGATRLLFLLGGIYLAALLTHGALKYVLNVYQNKVSEGVIRRLRNRFVDDPASGEEPGTRQAIVTAEAERLGGFVGESLSFPLLQGGMVASVIIYMLIVDPLVAVVAIGFFIPALIIVPLMQQRINRL
jgi:ABC-type multidrug transport system fused ATPase/permease subunit